MIFKVAERKGLLQVAPRIELPSNASRKPDILTTEMLKKVFPKERSDLREVWRNQDNKKEPDDAWLMFAALFSTMFYGGLRPQEARAVHVDQLHLNLGAILVTRSMDRQNQVQSYLKMGNQRDPRYRVAILPDRAVTIIQWWLEEAAPVKFVFTFAGRPTTKGNRERRDLDRRQALHPLQRPVHFRYPSETPPESGGSDGFDRPRG